MRRLLGPILLLAALAVAVPLPAQADTSDFTFDSFDADYTLTRLPSGHAHLEVVETIVALFPGYDQNRGIIRAIPDDYDGVDLKTEVSSVVDENGDPVAYEIDHTDGFVELALGTDEFVHGPTTYVISYSQEDVVRSFTNTDADEFYWDVNGTGWDQPFAHVRAEVHVDPSLVGSLSGRSACYFGPEGSNATCPLDQAAGTFTTSVRDLDPKETVTVAIGFGPDTFVTPPPTRGVPQPIPAWLDVLSGLVGLLGVGGAVGAIVANARSTRGAPGRGTIIPQYSELQGITIMQAAHLENRGTTAVPAALVRLAVRKNIRILAYAVEGTDEPYTLQYLTNDRANAEDQAILDIVFGADPEAGVTSPFGSSQQDEASALLALSGRANESLESAAFKERSPGRGIAALFIVGQLVLGIVAIAIVIGSSGAYANISNFLVATLVIGTLAFIVTLIAARRPLRLTAKGAEAHEFLLGMRMYLTLAEKDRLRALQSPQGAERVDAGNNQEMIKLYEKLLPWAVLWGVEDQWMRELALRVEAEPTQPDWFQSTDGFNATVFSSTLGGFRSTIFPAPTSSGSSWTSSGSGFGSTSSGGSFGGGFSGGGGGGGGGGGR